MVGQDVGIVYNLSKAGETITIYACRYAPGLLSYLEEVKPLKTSGPCRT